MGNNTAQENHERAVKVLDRVFGQVPDRRSHSILSRERFINLILELSPDLYDGNAPQVAAQDADHLIGSYALTQTDARLIYRGPLAGNYLREAKQLR